MINGYQDKKNDVNLANNSNSDFENNSNDNNRLELHGTIVSTPKLDHSVRGNDFYTFFLSVMRNSGEKDVLPVLISDKQAYTHPLKVGEKFAMVGQLRSVNKFSDGKNHLCLYAFCRQLEDYVADTNKLTIKGYTCKKVIYRTTPLGREIADVYLAVNRNYGKSDYIPCIVWGLDANYVTRMETDFDNTRNPDLPRHGLKWEFDGRLQSRKYVKIIDGNSVEKVAYEMSVSNAVVDKEQADSLGIKNQSNWIH